VPGGRRPRVDGINAYATGERARLSWQWHGSRAPWRVRILRSEEWFPASLEDAATGDWRATVAYEGAATAFVDGSLDPLREFAAPLGVITLARSVAVQRDRPNRGSTHQSTAHGTSTANGAPK